MNLALHKPSQLICCEVDLPGSKSISNRILIIKALSGLNFSILNLSDSDDTRHLQNALEVYKTVSVINVGHAGTDMRFLTAFLAIQNGSFELTGSDRLQQRPLKDLVGALKKLGADIAYKKEDGYPPLYINGKQLEGGEVEISGSVSSQFISALLLVAPYFTKGLKLTIVGELVSRPYVNMTIELMKEFGAMVSWTGDQLHVAPKRYSYSKKEFIVESDWSAASYYYSIVALSSVGSTLTLKGLSAKSLQADAVCADLYQSFAVTTKFKQDKISITKSDVHTKKSVLDLNMLECPDIAQTIVCTAAGLQCSFYISGLQTLVVKETDRLRALQSELKKMGIVVEITDSSIKWMHTGSGMVFKPVSISTYNDHRMAMSFAPLCLQFDRIVIEDAGVVSKSYPLFWEHLKQIGINQTLL